MLAGMLLDKGGHSKNRSHRESTSLGDIGLDRNTSHRWQSIASIPEAVFEKFVRETVGAGKEPQRPLPRRPLSRRPLSRGRLSGGRLRRGLAGRATM